MRGVNASTGRRIVLTTFGSLGDLHPYIALAQGLRARGHRPVIATTDSYRERVEAARIDFVAIRPSESVMGEDRHEILRKASDPKNGTEYVVRELALPWVRDSYEDLLATCTGADVLVTHPLVYAGPLVAQKLQLAWASSVLQPLIFLSASDPPVFAGMPWLKRIHWFPPVFFRLLWKLPRRMTTPWMKTIYDLREEIGLPRFAGHPMFEGQYSLQLNLALFSPHLSPPQSDWPANTVTTGFLVYDRNQDGSGMESELANFVKAGPPPVVFTLGSSVVAGGKDFYRISFEVARKLGVRAVLLTGSDQTVRPENTSPDIFISDYAPYSELFPNAAAVVHQGGVGTTGQVLVAGVPQIVVPHAHDQPDNASRIERLGVGCDLPIARYTQRRATSTLRKVLETPSCRDKAKAIGELVRKENGLAAACDALESLANAKA